jgi:hypothetical protein
LFWGLKTQQADTLTFTHCVNRNENQTLEKLFMVSLTATRPGQQCKTPFNLAASHIREYGLLPWFSWPPGLQKRDIIVVLGHKVKLQALQRSSIYINKRLLINNLTHNHRNGRLL